MEPRGGLAIVPESEAHVEHVPLVSTLAYRAVRDPHGIRAVAEWARGIEIRIANVGMQPGDAEHEALRQALRGYSGLIGFYPSPAELNLGSVRCPQLRELSVRVYREFLAIAADLGATYVVLSPHFPHPSLAHRDAAKARLVDALGVLGQEAQQRGILLLIENMAPAREYEVLEVREYFGLFDYSIPGIAPMLDVGHAYLSGWDLPRIIRILGPRLAGLHLHDNHGIGDVHLPIGLGSIEWPPVWEAVQLTYRPLRLVLEYRAGAHDPCTRDYRQIAAGRWWVI